MTRADAERVADAFFEQLGMLPIASERSTLTTALLNAYDAGNEDAEDEIESIRNIWAGHADHADAVAKLTLARDRVRARKATR